MIRLLTLIFYFDFNAGLPGASIDLDVHTVANNNPRAYVDDDFYVFSRVDIDVNVT